MLEKELMIVNKLGLHARAAAKFVATAGRFSSKITVRRAQQEVNGKSIMGIMALAATQQTLLHLIVEGEDEDEAFKAIVELINNKFEEDE